MLYLGTSATPLEITLTGNVWSYTQAVPAGQNGSDNYKLELKDKAGNTNSKRITVIYDKKAPNVAIRTPVANQIYKNPSFDFNGTASDPYAGVANVVYKIYENTGTAKGAVKFNGSCTFGDDEWTGSRTFANNEQDRYYLEITATDFLGNVGTAEVKFSYDVIRPNIQEGKITTAKTSTGWYTTKNVDIEVEAQDNESGLFSVSASTDGTNFDAMEVASSQTGVTSGWTKYIRRNVVLEDGTTNTITIKAKDNADNESLNSASEEFKKPIVITGIKVDTKKPEFSAINVPKAMGSTDVEITGKLTEINLAATDGFKVVGKLNGEEKAAGNNTFIVTPATAGTNKSWSILVKKDSVNHSTDGKWEFTVTAKDEAGQTATSDVMTTTIDTKAPTFIANPTISGWLNDKAQELTVHVSDNEDGSNANASGIKTVTYSVNGAAAKSMSDIGEYSSDSHYNDYQATLNLSEGTSTIVVNAEDIAGNTVEVGEFIYHIDTKSPVVETKSDTTVITNDISGFTVIANVKDETGGSGIAAVYVVDPTDSTETPIVSATAADISTANNGASNISLVIPSSVFASEDKYSFTIKAKDNAGNVGQGNEITVTFDTSVPVFKDNPTIDEWLDAKGQTLTVHVSDNSDGTKTNASGIQKVTYTITGDTTKAETAMAAGSVYNTNYTDYTATVTLNPGESTVTVTATDNAGNSITAGTFTYNIDTVRPTITGVQVYKSSDSTTKTEIALSNEPVTISGKLTEANLAATDGFTVAATKGGTAVAASGSTYAITTTPSAGENKDWAIKLLSASNDGDWEFTFTAKDEAGNTASVTKTVTIDTIAPAALAVNDSAKPFLVLNQQLYAATGHNWYRLETLPVTGYFNETGTGIDTVYLYLWNKDRQTNSVAKPSDITTGNADVTTAPAVNTGTQVSYQASVSGFDGSNATNYNQLLVQAVDKAGNKSTIAQYNIYVDQTAPSFSANYYSFDGGVTVNEVSGTILSNQANDMILYGTFSDTDSGVDELMFKLAGNAFDSNVTVTYTTATTLANVADFTGATYAAYDSANITTIKGWKAVIAGNAINTGAFAVVPKDLSGNGDSTQVFTFNVDKDSPEITLNSPVTKLYGGSKKTNGTTNNLTANDKVVYSMNNLITISGTAKDNNTLSTIDLYYSTTDSTASVATAAEGGANTKYGVTLTGSDAYTWSFANIPASNGTSMLGTDEVYDSTAKNTKTIYFKVKAVDTANNISVYVYEYKIDPEADRPIIKVTNVKAPDEVTGEYPLLKTKTLFGNIEDDDGTPDNLWYIEKPAEWSADKTYSAGKWVYSTTEGNYYVCIANAARGTPVTNTTNWMVANDANIKGALKPTGSNNHGWN